ncbi:hypothetical protein CerSpe_033490 [Prunus speciosa]
MLLRTQRLHDQSLQAYAFANPKPNFLKLKESDLISHLFYFHSFPPKCPKNDCPFSKRSQSSLGSLSSLPKRQLMKSRSPQDIYSLFFFLCKCWGSSLRVEGEDICGDFTMEALPPATGEDDNAMALLEPLDWADEEASIDLRAQMFIDRFYEEMRMQRQESF